MASVARCFKISDDWSIDRDINATNSSSRFTFPLLNEMFETTTVLQVQLAACFLLLLTIICICAYLNNLVAIYVSKVWADQPQFVQLIGHGMFDIASLFVCAYELLSSAVMQESMLSEIGSKILFMAKQYFVHAEYALLFIIGAFRACTILKPMKMHVIFTWKVALGSVLVVALVYSPLAIVLTLDCMVGYKLRVLAYDMWIQGPLTRRMLYQLLTSVVIPEFLLKVPLIFLTSLSYLVAITSLIYQKLKLQHIISHESAAGSSNAPQLNFRTELNLIIIGYWPVLMHTVSGLSRGRYPTQIFGPLGTIVIARIGIIMFNGAAPFIQLITSSQIRHSVAWFWKQVRGQPEETEFGGGKHQRNQPSQTGPAFQRAGHRAAFRTSANDSRFIEGGDDSSHHRANHVAEGTTHHGDHEDSYRSANRAVGKPKTVNRRNITVREMESL